MQYILLHSVLWIGLSFASLIEPTKIEITPGTSYHFSIEYCDFSVPPYITTMNAMCYCIFDPTTQTSSDCSIPGPTFTFHPGDQISWTWHNRLSGDTISDPALLNKYRDLDTTNIHTHGLHISPQDDNILVTIPPGSQHTYTYNIPSDHYPGLSWLHAHHHGSVSFQIASGLFSALEIKYTNNNDLLDDSLINMKENILMFHEIYVITTDLCDCNNVTQWQSYFYHPPIFETQDCISGKLCFQVFSHCYEYCSMPLQQRTLSGFNYNIQSEYANNFQLFLVNGQYNPIIDDIKINTFRRLRFVNSITQYYIQYKFPITNCEWHVIALDGIFLTDWEVRNVNRFPYLGEYLLAPGGRLDVIVKCSVIGIYDIIASENNGIDADLFYIGRVPTNTQLFQIEIITDGIDTVISPPLSYPPRPNYLKDLRLHSSEPCGCNTYFNDQIDNSRIVTWTEQQCGFVFNMQKNSHNVNGVVFDPNIPSTSIEYGKIYEFTLIPHMHAYHQHVNPFQLQQSIGVNGFQGKAGDWYDTIGGTRNIKFTFKTYPIDFTGMQMIHCHLLPHEDIGMMSYINILEPHQFCNISSGKVINPPTRPPLVAGATHNPSPFPTHNPSNNPSETPTKKPTNIPTITPTNNPTLDPTQTPSNNPSYSPSNLPSKTPSKSPSDFPTNIPTKSPTVSHSPTKTPSNSPSNKPSVYPSKLPTIDPTDFPTQIPTSYPSFNPTILPTKYPTNNPSKYPTQNPSNYPSISPTNNPSKYPTQNPSKYPTQYPSNYPSINPTNNPSIEPTFEPTIQPSINPTIYYSTEINVIEYEENNNDNKYFNIFGFEVLNNTFYLIILLIGGGIFGIIVGVCMGYFCVCKPLKKTKKKNNMNKSDKHMYTNVVQKQYKHMHGNKSAVAITDLRTITEKENEMIEPINVQKNLLNEIIELSSEDEMHM